MGQGPVCRRYWSQLTFRGELGAGAGSHSSPMQVQKSVALSGGSLGTVSQICGEVGLVEAQLASLGVGRP